MRAKATTTPRPVEPAPDPRPERFERCLVGGGDAVKPAPWEVRVGLLIDDLIPSTDPRAGWVVCVLSATVESLQRGDPASLATVVWRENERLKAESPPRSPPPGPEGPARLAAGRPQWARTWGEV